MNAQVPIVPPAEELGRSFGEQDERLFMSPSKVYYPETWFHYISGNVSENGITADLEAIEKAGFSGIQLFHGHFTNEVWPGVDKPITCLSPLWNHAVNHTARECDRLGLRFTMQNCPGWAMSGGPWIQPSNAMRHLVFSRTDLISDSVISELKLPLPQPSTEDWRDYKDVTVLAFPTPQGDTNEPLKPLTVKSDREEFPWMDWLQGKNNAYVHFPPATKENPHWVEVTFPESVMLRTVEFPCIQAFNHGWCYEPGVYVTIQAILPNDSIRNLLRTDLPQSNWQDDQLMTLACPEVEGGTNKYRIEIVNKYDMGFNSFRLYSAARKNNWEAEAGWTLRSIERKGENPQQSSTAFVQLDKIIDISEYMDAGGNLRWKAPIGKWTVLRIGNVNTGQRNGPAPPEGTGWECNKLSKSGSGTQFANYIGKLSNEDGPVGNGLLKGMLLDSWECKTQTWTADMENEFERIANYPLRKWLPAVFGYVIDDHETTTRFLRDWKKTINDLFVENFFGNMAAMSEERGLSLSYETSGGDVFPVDILEYHKYADVPMCEFWQPMTNGYVGSLNFKPIKPAASAARMYGKPRVAAEAFTSFSHTWDEHLSMLKEVANINSIEGVSHLVFHTYTHNPQVNFLPPGTSFGGAGIGTPFLRGQTWWKHMLVFNSYLARCSYLLERGKPVSDVLWYLGDEMDHKPDQNAIFPEGYKYDYCNPDALLNRLSVENGLIVTPENIRYRVLWIPENRRMLPQTLEKLYSLISEGATVIGNAPKGLATLSNEKTAQKRFNAVVKKIWGKNQKKGIQKVGKGYIISGKTLLEALKDLELAPDIRGGDALWVHRRTDNADWYFVCAPEGKGFQGILDFRSIGKVELWDPETGIVTPVGSERKGERTSVALDLPQAGSCFVVFRDSGKSGVTTNQIKQKKVWNTIPVASPWTLSFPEGWGAPASLQISELKVWKDLDISPEAKAFSGTVTYRTTFDVGDVKPGMNYQLHLGQVNMIAEVKLNNKILRTAWAPPYQVNLTEAIRAGKNELIIEVTSSWFNRLVYDAGQPMEKRKTWVVRSPDKNSILKDYGLLGPVSISVEQ